MNKFSRREMVKNTTYLATAGLFLGLAGCLDKKKAPEANSANTTATEAPKAAPAGDGDPLISEDHGTAKSLKYKHDGSTVDAALKIEKAGVAGSDQNCANCQFYKPVDGKEHGKCQLIPVAGKHVASKGWCVSWSKKA